MNSLISANMACLAQGIELLEQINPKLYRQTCPEVFESSIGGHIRHTIDHYGAFLGGAEGGEIDYDARERDLSIEEDAGVAIGMMRKLMAGLEELAGADLERPLRICMDDGGDSGWSRTTLRRELQFLLSHSIHHYALVVSIATRSGLTEFPQGCGVAPSTRRYLEREGA